MFISKAANAGILPWSSPSPALWRKSWLPQIFIQIAGWASLTLIEIWYLCPIFSDESTLESKAASSLAPPLPPQWGSPTQRSPQPLLQILSIQYSSRQADSGSHRRGAGSYRAASKSATSETRRFTVWQHGASKALHMHHACTRLLRLQDLGVCHQQAGVIVAQRPIKRHPRPSEAATHQYPVLCSAIFGVELDAINKFDGWFVNNLLDAFCGGGKKHSRETQY